MRKQIMDDLPLISLGRYANIPTGPIPGASISIDGLGTIGATGSTQQFQNVYELTLGAEFLDSDTFGAEVGVVLKFGPQGRNFDNDPILSASVTAQLGELGINVGSLDLSADYVSFTVGDGIEAVDFFYTSENIGTELISDFSGISDDEAILDAAETAASILATSMKLIGAAKEIVRIKIPSFPGPQDFQTKFVPVSSVSIESFEANVFLQLEIYDENHVGLRRTEVGSDIVEYEVWEIQPEFLEMNSVQDAVNQLLEAREENPYLPLELFFVEYVPAEPIGAYVDLPFRAGIIDALESVFDAGTTDPNEAPILINPLEDQVGQEDTQLDFSVPEGTFIDIDGDALTLIATLTDDSVLPDWLSFDATTGTFTGVPPLDSSGDILVTVTASDGELSVSDEFILTVSSDDTGNGGGGGGIGTLPPLESQVDGTEGADTIDATYVDGEGDLIGNTADTIYGFGGDDTINSGNGADIIYGGDGNDTINGGRGSNAIDGGAGDDTIYVIDSSVVDGGAGDDHLSSNLNKGGDHTFTGGAGADTFEFNYAGTKAAIETITDFEIGVDTLIVQGQMLSGLAIEGLPSDFTTSAAADGSLVLNYGVIHSVTLNGVTSEEFFADIGVTAAATVGTAGDDVIDATFSDAEGDTVSDGAETIFGLGGNDTINAGKGNDTIYGGDGNDIINPDRGSKTIYGENGDDTIYVIDSSVVDGGAGNDHLFSNLNKGGDHTFTGGTGMDTFEFAYAGATKAANEIITDFEVGIDALIIDGQTLSGLTLGDLPPPYTSTTDDGSLVLNYGGIHSVTLEGVTEAEFFSL